MKSVIGLPPDIGGDIGDPERTIQEFNGVFNLKWSAFPILILEPCKVSKAGITGYTIEPDIDNYNNDLSIYEISPLVGDKLQVACMADNLPSESFTNTFGESVLFAAANAASEGFQDLAFLLGGAAGLKDRGDAAVDAMGTMIPQEARDKIKSELGHLKDKATGAPNMAKDALAMGGGLITGQRTNFPLLWRNANYQPSMSFTVKLYNPAPGNAAITKEYIVDPLIALLLFVVPRSSNGMTYEWPFMCKFQMPGILQQYAGYVSNISVIKGGNERTIGFNQRMGMIELKIDLGILYPTMVSSPHGLETNTETPRLKEYAQSLLQAKPILNKDNKGRIITQLSNVGIDTSDKDKIPLSRLKEGLKDKFNELKKNIGGGLGGIKKVLPF